ncbi:MAG: hypothetical protein CMJ94_05005 [Planctomycetes bacterium]|nr:hypothetical protein [Planctomycetota bacterium]
MSVSRVLILALVGLLLGTTGCKLTPPTENEFEFTAVFEDDFSSLRGRAWDAQRRQGGKEPRVRDGRLELRSDDAGFGVARSIVELRKRGYYHAFEARMAASSTVDESRAELILGYREGTENPDVYSARWRISYAEGEARWTVQPVVLDEDLAVVVSGPTSTVAAGAFADYRVELDLLRGTITWRIDGSLFWQTTRENMQLDAEGGPVITHFIGGELLVDSARAERIGASAELTFDNVREGHRAPKRVEMLFSLRDVDDEPVVIGRSRLGIDLVPEVLEDGAPLDEVESPVHLRGAEELDLDLVLVLDYTESMRAAGGGTGIDTMKDAARRLIFDRAPQHRIAVVEFHDNQLGDNYSTLVPFTTNKSAAWAAVRDYAPFHGFSSAWDAIDSGLELFPATPDPARVTVLAFLSDGFDTSSTATPQSIIDKAQARDVTIFNVGVEDVRGVDELELERISNETGGRYFHAEQISELLARFDQIDAELSGQYKVAYVTAQAGSFELTLWVTANGTRVLEPIVRTVDGAAIDGDTREGIVSASPVEVTAGTARFAFVGEHLPRRISSIRFQFDPTGTPLVQDDISVSIDTTGPLVGWTVQRVGDWWEASGPDASFGDFGRMFAVEIANIGGGGFDLPFTWDNTLYSNGVLFYGGDPGELIGGNWQSAVTIP